ncbi:MAG: YlqD family protein [Thermosynechococcaceae cyanobacterium MS004]|jgi:flagellar hook-associated protein FlgK|nr:YlqD family protein [Thermosynechococcaceae cyanobacterium MS004]
MDILNDQLLLRRAVPVKAIVTPLWKEEAQQQLQAQINQFDTQLQQLELQVQQMMSELKRQLIGQPSDNLNAQIQDLQAQANAKKSELLEQKNQILQQLNQVQVLEFEQEVEQGQIDNFFYIKKGDHLIQRMQVEIVIRDGVVEDIRGEL